MSYDAILAEALRFPVADRKYLVLRLLESTGAIEPSDAPDEVRFAEVRWRWRAFKAGDVQDGEPG